MYTVARRGIIKQFETMNCRRFVQIFKGRMLFVSSYLSLQDKELCRKRLRRRRRVKGYGCSSRKEDYDNMCVMNNITILSYINVNRKSCVFLVQTFVLQHKGCIESECERVYKNMWFEEIHRDREADLLLRNYTPGKNPLDWRIE